MNIQKKIQHKSTIDYQNIYAEISKDKNLILSNKFLTNFNKMDQLQKIKDNDKFKDKFNVNPNSKDNEKKLNN